MAVFDLLSVDPLLLAKIINKLEDNSYFCLQQTSKVINETIRSIKQISVHVSVPPRGYELYFKNDEGRKKWSGEVDAECFYGVRFDKYFHRDRYYGENTEVIKKETENLKKYRITCDKLDLTFPGTTTEQMEMLLDALKPRVATVDDYGNRNPKDDAKKIETLLQSRTLKEVYIVLDAEHGARLVPQLLAKFSSVHINGNVYDNEEQLKLLRIILENLRSQPLPHLQNVSLWSYPMGELYEQTSFETIQKEFSDLSWTYEREGGEDVDWFWSLEKDKEVDDNEDDGDLSEANKEENDEEQDNVEEIDEKIPMAEEEDKEEDGKGGPPEVYELDEDDDDDSDDEEEEEDEDDYERREEVIEKFIAHVEFPNGHSGRIQLENSSEHFRTQLLFEIGERQRFPLE